jgi:hypothetical protein
MATRKERFDSEGVSNFCDFCNKPIDKNNSFTWLVNGKPANRRFCSAECQLDYYGEKDEKP